MAENLKLVILVLILISFFLFMIFNIYEIIKSVKFYNRLEKQMKDLQSTSQSFQTSDTNKNTENMFKELENKKESLNLSYLNEINYQQNLTLNKADVFLYSHFLDAYLKYEWWLTPESILQIMDI